MEFTNEIFFNKPLIAGNTVIITYSGQLYREHSKDISIVFGYGDNWSETDSAPMIETENGFEVTLTIKNYNTFNFCFNNSFNIWDNNYGFNYIAPISQESNKQINEDALNINEQEFDNTQSTDCSNTEIEKSSSSDIEIEDNLEEQSEENQISDNSTNESSSDTDNISDFENKTTSEDIETLFSSLLDSILDEKNSKNESIDISTLSGFGLQSIDEINEENIINCDEIFAELFEELSGKSNSTTNIPNENSETQINDDIKLNNIDLINTIEKTKTVSDNNISNVEIIKDTNENEIIFDNNDDNENTVEIIFDDSDNNKTDSKIICDDNNDNEYDSKIIFDNSDDSETDSKIILDNSDNNEVDSKMIFDDSNDNVFDNTDDIDTKFIFDNGNDNENIETTNNSNDIDTKNELQNQAESEVTNFDNYDFQELDNLMDNLLMAITENQPSTETATPVENIKSQDLSNENVNFPATLEDTNQDWLDKIINASYSFSKKFSTACKKIGNIIKLKAKEFGLIGNKK